MGREISVNVPKGMCFHIINDDNPQIQGEYEYAKEEYRFQKIGIYKAHSNITIKTTGSVAYWKC